MQPDFSVQVAKFAMPIAPQASSKFRLLLLRQLNERQILATLRSNGPLSRADLSRNTGISGPTVTGVVATLIDSGLVEEDEPRQGIVGRPGKIVRLARTSVCVLDLRHRGEALRTGRHGSRW